MADVTVSIGAVTSELKAGLSEAGDMLKEWRKEERAEDKNVKFFADKVRAIADAAGVSNQALGTLLGGLAVGGPMGLAMGGVKALIELVQESGKAEREAAEEATKAADKRVDAYRKAALELAKLQYLKAGGNAEVWEAGQANAAAQAEVDKARKAAEEARAKFDAKKAERNLSEVSDTNIAAAGGDLAQMLKQVQAAEQALKTAKDTLAATQQAGSIKAGASVDKESKDAADKAKAKREQEAAAYRALLKEQATATAEFADEEAKIRATSANKVMDLQAQMDAATSARQRAVIQDLIDQERAAVEVRVRLAREEAQRKADAEADVKFERDARIQDELDKAREKRQEEERKQLEQMASAYQAWGERVGNVVAAAFTRGGSPAKAMAALMKDVLRSILDAARKQIIANALATGSEAAKSQAGVPLAGPALAAVAMSSMIGLVMALVSSLPSAKGGWDLPDFEGGALAVLHGGEKVLNRRTSQAVDWMADQVAQMQNGDGLGGSRTVIQVQAFDGPSVERVANDNSSSFRRALQRDQRRRRT